MSVQIHLSNRKKNRMIKFNTLSKLLGATALVGGMFLTLPQEAFATSAGQYCVGFVSSGAPEQCFTTFGASISAATDGRVVLANATSARYVSPSELSSPSSGGGFTPLAVPPPSVVLGIIYSGSNYTGSSFVWTGTGCSATVGGNNMPGGWNDRTRSVATYSGCATTLFANTNYGSPAYLIHVNSAVSDLGSFDGTASSELFCNYY